MDIIKISHYILKKPQYYPGHFHYPQTRTSEILKPIEPISQMLLIWKCTIEFIKDQLQQGKGVHYRRLGAFCYDFEQNCMDKSYIEVQKFGSRSRSLQRISASNNMSFSKDFTNLKPKFIPDPDLLQVLSRYLHQVSPEGNIQKTYSQYKMTYLNPVPISKMSYFDKSFVEEVLQAFAKAFIDLAECEKILYLQFDFALITIWNKNLKVEFETKFLNQSKRFDSVLLKKKSVSKNWSVSSKHQQGNSRLNNFIAWPDKFKVRSENHKTLMLEIASKDMYSVMSSKDATEMSSIQFSSSKSVQRIQTKSNEKMSKSQTSMKKIFEDEDKTKPYSRSFLPPI